MTRRTHVRPHQRRTVAGRTAVAAHTRNQASGALAVSDQRMLQVLADEGGVMPRDAWIKAGNRGSSNRLHVKKMVRTFMTRTGSYDVELLDAGCSAMGWRGHRTEPTANRASAATVATRVPFQVGATYRFDNFIPGTFVLGRTWSQPGRGSSLTYTLLPTDASYHGSVVNTIEDFYALLPTLVTYDTKQLPYDLQDLYYPMYDPGEDRREIFTRVSTKLAELTGEPPILAGRTEKVFDASWKRLYAAVGALADKHNIDAYHGNYR